MILLCIVAAGSGLLLLLGWLGYPVALRVLAAWKRPKARVPAASRPDGVSVVIATREPPEVVSSRCTNLHECDPADAALEVVVAVDFRAAYPLSVYQAACGDRARVVQGDQPGGKACTLNAGVRESSHAFLLFTDSAQTFAPDAIRELLRCFEDASIGCATGTWKFGQKAAAGALLKVFWSYELMLREMESRIDSVVAVTGAIYALRRELWSPLPAGLICDDLFVPMAVVRRGRRVVACPSSHAYDDRHFSRAEEFRRKVRTLTGMLQFCALCPWALSPIHNRIWLQFVCHKLLRLSTPYLLVLGAATAVLCLGSLTWVLPSAAFLLLLAAILLLAPKESVVRRVRGQLIWAGYLLAAPVVATLNALRGNWDVWSAGRQRHAG